MRIRNLLPVFLFLTTVLANSSCKKESTNPPVVNVVVGQNYGGGIVFYVDSTNHHGLTAATTDQSLSATWNNGTNVSVSTGFLIGDGQANTTAIVNAQGAGAYAAAICNDLVLGGFSDWFLPSKNELDLLQQNRDLVGGFQQGTHYYWSSSQSDMAQAWRQNFANGGKICYDKNSAFYVRAVRAF